MDLKDLLAQFADDPEEVKRRQELNEKLEALRIRLYDLPEAVKDADIVEAIQVRFKMVSGSDFLDEATWLMNALSFTRAPIAEDMIQEAWQDFQKANDLPYLSLDDYPILEAMANWYFEHRQDPERDETAMVLRSLALYEYLLAQVRGHESDSEYEHLLSGIGPIVVSLYCALGIYGRAKFYIQLLVIEHKSNRIPEEDYLEVMKAHELLLIKERGEATTTVEKELHKINRLCWDTISARNRQIDRLGQEKAELLNRLTRVANPALFAEAARRLSGKFGIVWERLHTDTRRFLEIADVLMQEPFLNSWPGGGATCTYLAVKSELLCRFRSYLGSVVSEALKKAGGDPVKLLLIFGNDKKRLFNPEERESIRSVLHSTFGGKLNLTEHTRAMIELVKDHRDKAQHPEERGLYGMSQFEDYHQKVWTSGWICSFLGCGLQK